MVCHLSDGFKMYMGLKPVSPASLPYPRSLLKWVAPWAPIPWPKGFNTVPELDQQAGGTPPMEFDNDVRELQSLVDCFTRKPRAFQWQVHPQLARCLRPNGCDWNTFTWITICGSSEREEPNMLIVNTAKHTSQ